MMGFLKWLLVGVVVLIGIFFVGGFLIPAEWTVSRSATIAAPIEVIYTQVSNLHKWQDWSPWTKEKDPTQEYSYEGPESGVGAKWLWKSKDMGTGWLEIKHAEPTKGITYELYIDMGKMQSTLYGDIVFKPTGSAVEVVWTDRGDSGDSFVKRWMSLMVGNMLGKDLENGLAKLKQITEAKK